MNKLNLHFSFSSILIFILLLLISDILIFGWLGYYKIDLGPIMDIRALFPLILFNLAPGPAALLTLILQRKSFADIFPLNFPKPLYLLIGYCIFPLIGFLAAAAAVLLNAADWDLSMIDFSHDFFVRFSHDPIIMSLYDHTRHNWQIWLFLFILSPIHAIFSSLIETIGWQGYYYRLCQSKGFWFTSLTSGLIWWLWQCPILLLGHPYAYHPFIGIAVGLGFGLTHQILLTWLRKITNNLWPVVLARATLAGAATAPLIMTTNYERIWSHLHGLIGVGIMGLFILLLHLFKLLDAPKDSNNDNRFFKSGSDMPQGHG